MHTPPPRLSKELLPKLKQSIANGRTPDPGTEHYDTFYDTWGELGTMLDEDITDAAAPAARREVGALVAFWSAIPWDGVLVGVACNRPEVLPVAQAAARSMNLPGVAALLDQVAAHVPAEVAEMGDAGARHEWYTEGPGAEHAPKLEEIEESINDSPEIETLLFACVNRIVSEPQHFFES